MPNSTAHSRILIKFLGFPSLFGLKGAMALNRKLSNVLIDTKTLLTEETTNLGDILRLFGDRGTAFILFLVALPAALPVPAIGLSIIIALPLLFLTFQQMIGRKVIWLPEELQEHEFKTASLISTIDKATPITKKIEILTKPRLCFLTTSFASCFIGAAGFIMSLSVLLPLPLTNTVPSIGITGMALGILMRDGLAVIIGAVIGLGWVFMLAALTLYFGGEAVDIIKGFFKSLG